MPTTLNLRFNRVPDPAKGDPVKAPMMRWPGLLTFDVIDIAELNVPDESNAGDAGVTTNGSKVTWRSYENTPRPVRLPTVIGTTITPPGVGVRLGSETATPVSEGETSGLPKLPSDALGSAKTRPKSLDMPIFSRAETIKPKREPPAANAVTLNNKASAITTNVM